MTISGEIADLRAAVSWIEKRKEVRKEKIGVNGLSLGGACMHYEKAGKPRNSLFVEGADHTYNRWDWQWMVIG